MGLRSISVATKPDRNLPQGSSVFKKIISNLRCEKSSNQSSAVVDQQRVHPASIPTFNHGDVKMPNKTSTVFISHAGPDAKQAMDLQQALSTVGIAARLDQVDLRLGDNVIKWMNEAASESDYLLVLVSKNSAGRYWVETKWSAALAREADLRRTFVVPVIRPGIEDKEIPFLLRAKLYLDLRKDGERALLHLINFLKQDQQVARECGRLPSPAPMGAQEEVANDFPECGKWLSVIVFSNRFARTFRFTLPSDATPSYILALLRSRLNLKWSNVDPDLMVELSYTYAIGFNGKHLPLDTPIHESGVAEGSMLELWIRVTLTNLPDKHGKVQNPSILMNYEWIGLNLDKTALKDETDRTRKLLMINRSFTNAQIVMIVRKCYSHVEA